MGNVIQFSDATETDFGPDVADALNNHYSDEVLSPEAKAKIVRRMNALCVIICDAISIRYSLPADAGFSEAQLAMIEEACIEAAIFTVKNTTAAVVCERMHVEARIERGLALIDL